jgi:hypothetical protein
LLKRRGELQYVEEWWAVEKPASNWAQRYFPVRNGAVHGEAAFALVSRYLQTSIETNRAENFAAEQSRQEQEAQRIEAERQKANADLEVSRRQRDRAVAGVFSVVLLLCAAVGYGYFVTTQKLRLQAQAIALRAEAALEYESPPKAALIALQSSKFNLPDVPEIERVLYRSVRDLQEKRVFETTGIAVLGVTYSPKGDIVAILERDKISFHDSTTGQILDRYDTADLNANWGHFQWSTDGKIIALSSRDQTVLLVPCSAETEAALFVVFAV